jgi:hypothetical protein
MSVLKLDEQRRYVEEDEDDEDMYGHGRWVTVYGFDVRRHADAALGYFAKADWTEMATLFNRVLGQTHGDPEWITADDANQRDMTNYLGSSIRNCSDLSITSEMQDMMSTVFEMEMKNVEDLKAKFKQDRTLFNEFKDLYIHISEMDRLMILDHHVGQGNSMDIQFATARQARRVLNLNGEELNLALDGNSSPRTRMIIGMKRTEDIAKQQRRVVPPNERRLNHIPGNRGNVRVRTDAHSGLPDGATRRKRISTRAPEYMVVDHVSIMKHPERQMSCCEMIHNFFTNGW